MQAVQMEGSRASRTCRGRVSFDARGETSQQSKRHSKESGSFPKRTTDSVSRDEYSGAPQLLSEKMTTNAKS